MKSDPYELIKATERLPSPKGVALEILRLTEDENTTIEVLSAVIESDPALSSKLLKIVNSPLAGMPRTIASLTRAAVLLGFKTVANLALSLSLISDNRDTKCDAFDYDAFWSKSLARAVAARHLSKLVKIFSHDEAFTCALLAKIGRLAFASAYPDRYSQALSVIGDDLSDLTQFEQELFGIDHNALSAEMMTDWHIADVFTSAVRAQEKPDASDLEADSRPYKFAQMLHLCHTIATVLMESTVDPDTLSAITNEAFHLGVRPEVLQEAFDSIREEWRDAGRIFSIPTRDVPTLAEIHSRCTKRRTDLSDSE